MSSVTVRVMHASGQFSDSPEEHEHDAHALFDAADGRDAWAVTGTEAGAGRRNHDLRDALLEAGKVHGFRVYAHPFGEWVALSWRHLSAITHGYAGPFIAGTHGVSAAAGGHAPRGIAWQAGAARDHNLGRLTFGSTHWLTHRSIAASGIDNSRMRAGSRLWAGRHGKASGCVFLNGDANEDDARLDLFRGEPFSTLGDELGRHPVTHDGGGRIDFLASYDRDGRVAGKAYRVLEGVNLYSDHRLLFGAFLVRERHDVP